jgi:hypothetical protein
MGLVWQGFHAVPVALRLAGRTALINGLQTPAPAGSSVTARKDDASAADQSAITKIVGLMLFSGGGGLIQTTSDCRQQRVLRLQRRG